MAWKQPTRISIVPANSTHPTQAVGSGTDAPPAYDALCLELCISVIRQSLLGDERHHCLRRRHVTRRPQRTKSVTSAAVAFALLAAAAAGSAPAGTTCHASRSEHVCSPPGADAKGRKSGQRVAAF